MPGTMPFTSFALMRLRTSGQAGERRNRALAAENTSPARV